MLLRFFRINDPYRLIGLLILLIALSLTYLIDPADITFSELRNMVLGEAIADGKLMYVQVYDNTPPLAALLFGMIDFLFGRSQLARQILALAVIFFQCSYFAIILIRNKVHTENTYLVALIFGLISFFSFDLLSLSPELLASTVLLFALNHLFNSIEFKIQRDDVLVKLGVYLGLATFLVFSYWVFLLAVLFVLVAFTRTGTRKIALLVLGFLLPHLLLITFYYYWDGLSLLVDNYYIANLTISREVLVSTKSLLILGSVPLTYFLFSFFMMNRAARFTKYQSQLLQVMFFWLLFALAQIFFEREVTPSSFITFIPSFAYFISHYLLLIRRRWIAEIMLWVFLTGTVCISLLSRYDRVEGVDYNRMFLADAGPNSIKDKQVMILGEEWSLYKHNSLGGYFLNWDLSKEVFESHSTYRQAEVWGKCFENPPAVIVDEENLMPGVFSRLPYLKSRYRKEGNTYWKINN